MWNIKIIHLQKAKRMLNCQLSSTNKEIRYIHIFFFQFMIGNNKIPNLGIDFASIIDFSAHIIEKIYILIENYYQLHGHSNRVNYFKILQMN